MKAGEISSVAKIINFSEAKRRIQEQAQDAASSLNILNYEKEDAGRQAGQERPETEKSYTDIESLIKDLLDE